MLNKAVKKISKFLIVFSVILGISFSNIPFNVLSNALDSYIAGRNIVDRAWYLSQNDNVVDKFVSYRNLLEKTKISEAQAAVSFVGSAESSSVPNTDTTVDLTTITGLAEGDIVIVAGAIGDDDNLNHDVLINTAGYTEIADLFSNDTDDTNLAVWWKIMGPTPDTSVVVEGSTGGTDSSLAVVAMAFRGVDQITPFDVASTIATGIDSFNPNPPSINHNNPSGIWTVIAGASGHIIAGTGTYTFPTGYTTNGIDRGQNDTNDITVGMGYRSSGVLNPEDPGVMTHSGTLATTNSWTAVTMALRPATNTAPSATAPGSISQATDNSGYISFQTTVSDPELNNTKLKTECSPNNGANWYDNELVSAVPSAGTVDLNNSNAYQIGTTDAIDTSGGSVILTINWNSKTGATACNLNNTYNTQVKIRVTPNDSLADGTVAESITAFTVDDRTPQGLTSFSSPSKTANSVALQWNSGITEDNTNANFNKYVVCYGTSDPGTTYPCSAAGATAWDNNNDANLATISTINTTITGLTKGTLYYFHFWAVDDFGNRTDGGLSSVSARPNAAPTISISQPDGIGDNVTAGATYNITYSLSDTDDVVTAAFYYDTNTNNGDGYTAITGECATAPETNTTCAWDTTGLSGPYYVYGIVNDGVDSDNTYSPGVITITSAAPSISSLNQHQDNQGTAISNGGYATSTQVDFTAQSSSGTTGGTMYLQVELVTNAGSFTSPPGSISGCVNCYEESNGVYGGGTMTLWLDSNAILPTLTDGVSYKWQARVRYNPGSDYYSAWTVFNATTPNFIVDASGPVISSVCAVNPSASSCDASSPTDVQAQIRWSTDESANEQVIYGTGACVGISSTQPASPTGSGTTHSVVLSNLSSSSTYYYRVRSADSAGNISYSPSASTCNTFTTSAAVNRLMKTNEYFISQYQNIFSGTDFSSATTTDFDIFVSELDALNSKEVTVKSAYIEVFGVGKSSANYAVQAGVNSQTAVLHNVASSGTNAVPFYLLYKVNAGTLNFDYPASSTATNTLTISWPTAPDNSVSLLGARLILTYYYTP